MRHLTRIAAWVAGLPIAALALVLIGGNTAPGRHLAEHLIATITGGTVRVAGLAGRFPDRLRAARVEIADGMGIWARIDGLRLDWSPLSLLRGTAQIDRLAAARVVVSRRPVLAGGATALPVPIAIGEIRADRVDLAAPAAGIPAALGLRGSLHLAALDEGRIDVVLKRLDAAGRCRLAGRFSPAALALELAVTEPPRGLVANLAGLPDLGALAITARLHGPPAAARTRLAIDAGALRLRAAGTLDLVRDRADLDLSGTAPAMAPRPGLSWRAATLTASLSGPLLRPRARGRLDIDGLAVMGGGIGQVHAELAGDSGGLGVTATLSGLRVPGPQPDLFAAAPLRLRAEARLDRPARPVDFAVSHPLLAVTGRIDTAPAITGSATLRLADLRPFSAPAGIDLDGRAAVTAWFSGAAGRAKISASGAAHLAGGRPEVLALLGGNPGFSFAGAWQGGAAALDRLAIAGNNLRLAAAGTDKAGLVDIGWKLAVADLSAFAPELAGQLTAAGDLRGPQRNLTMAADLAGSIGRAGYGVQPIAARLAVTGLPASPAAQITGTGKLAGAELRVAADLRRARDGTLGLMIDRASWNSAALTGELSLSPGAAMPRGRIRLTMTRLADLAPLAGLAITGAADGTLDFVTTRGAPQARLALTARRFAVADAAADRLTLDGTLVDPLRRRGLSLRLALDGIRAHGVSGNARLTVSGPAEAPAWRLATALRTQAGTTVPLAAAGTARLAPGALLLTAIDAGYGDEVWHLLAPARIGLAGGLTVNGLRLGSGNAVLAASGRLTPTLALDLSLRNAGPALARPFLPVRDAEGSIAIAASLRGRLAAPEGPVRVTGRGLRLADEAVPPATFDMAARLMRGAARLDATLATGGPTARGEVARGPQNAVRLRLAGTMPLRSDGPLALDAAGTVDLAVLDPLLTANGQALHGRVTLAAGIAGTPAMPRVAGTLRLAGGEFQDFTQGIHLTDISAVAEAAGDRLQLRRLAARAGSGTIAIAGTASLAPGLPIDLTLTARRARVLASSLVTADTDAALTLRGRALGRLDLAGHIGVDHAEIDIPDELPQDIPVLEIRRPGEKPQPVAASPVVGLDLDIAAPGYIRLRGRGLDAEMSGRLHIAGTAAQPQIRGGFTLRRGAIDLAGQTLNFTTGTIGFDGRSLSGRLDPLLDLTAQSSANGVSATLQVSGYADAPKVTLSSTPPLPQDEILAQLLFGQSVKQLSPFQLAEIGQGLAALGGASRLDPLRRVRRDLGLDRLSVGSGTTGKNGATGVALEAGKYLGNRVYVGAKQTISGGAQAQLRVDLTRHLKLDATLGKGGAVPATTPITPANDPGSSLGLTYQLEY
jgi:translocation and assembly module TamB